VSKLCEHLNLNICTKRLVKHPAMKFHFTLFERFGKSNKIPHEKDFLNRKFILVWAHYFCDIAASMLAFQINSKNNGNFKFKNFSKVKFNLFKK